MALLTQPFAILDLETTGLDPTQHEIIEIAALIVHTRFQVADEFHVLIQPSQPLPSEISALTGIAQSLLDNSGVTLHEGLAGLQAFLGGLPVFAHYAPFDQGFLRHAGKQCGVSFGQCPKLS
ncbi:3'-5' exonuclease [Acidithiobacillus sp.]|uniref:3'-5' exonuclease n=1 Tax=Acidithiobacillus sp. TaxID=1872118 RepID=UPI0031FE4495